MDEPSTEFIVSVSIVGLVCVYTVCMFIREIIILSNQEREQIQEMI